MVSRVFFLEENGDPRLIPWQRYERLYFRDPAIRFPEYACRDVKGVHAVVELEDRTPLSIVETNFFVTYFDQDGRIDRERKLEAQRLLAKIRRDGSSGRDAGNMVIDITAKLLEKKYHRVFRWAPTEKEAARLEQQIEHILGISAR